MLGPARRRFHAAPEAAGIPSAQEHVIEKAQLALLDEPADDLYFLSRAVLDTIRVTDERSPDRHLLLAALNRSYLLIDWSKPGTAHFYESVRESRDLLRSELRGMPKHSAITVRCIGHTHIDVAWLWQLKHTREKTARSFATVLRLMERYPEYIFLQTQPQLYEYLKTDYPQLYEQIQNRIKKGTWEAAGGMWLEADCNLTSGESLVRQLLFGIRFLREAFGVECTYLWLPDVFGYSWALPQILRKSGIETFMTTKIFGNQFNQMPHHTFKWRGIDGTEVLTHLAGWTYNGVMNAESLDSLWAKYPDKGLNRELLFVYGYGDGGGGVNRDMLEMRRRLNEMPGMPHVETSRVDDYFETLRRTVDQSDQYVHTWEGELYFEYHRGTYTSQAFVKRANRKCELALREAEWLNVALCVGGSGEPDWSHYPIDTLREAWKIVLRNQFHDIIPGSSIREVYEDCEQEYAAAQQLIRDARDNAEAGLVADAHDGRTADAGAGRTANIAAYDNTDIAAYDVDIAADISADEHARFFTVFNGSSWNRTDLLRIPAQSVGDADGVWLNADGQPLIAQRSGSDWLLQADNVPAMGYAELRFMTGQTGPTEQSPPSFLLMESGIVTPFYELQWNERGQLTVLFDRQNGRNVLPGGARGNVLQLFEDKPLAHDAWDIDIFYGEKMHEIDALSSVRVTENGPLRAVVEFIWRYGDSVIAQNLVVYSHSRKIDFETTVDWHERQQLLKVAFPVEVRATEATYDIQFGNVKRPAHWSTSWDWARFETVGHQWADLSERGYGVSLLNDCKYGYDIKDNVLRLTLLTSSIFPDYAADQGYHTFTYALLPHDGDWLEGDTVREAWDLNNPLSFRAGRPHAQRFSLLRPSSAHVLIDAVKKAEDDNAVIVRFHEFAGGRSLVELFGDKPVEWWQECDLMERPIGERMSGGNPTTSIKPYEIKTYRISYRERSENSD